MLHLRHAFRTRPHFVAYLGQRIAGGGALDRPQHLRLPLLTWTVRTPEQRERAARYADQMIFEGFRAGNLTARCAALKSRAAMHDLWMALVTMRDG